MGQMKRRFLILGLSLLVLIVALAGLFSALDVLPKSPNSVNNNPQQVNPPPENDSETPVDLTPDVSLDRDTGISLMDIFDFDLSKAMNALPALKGKIPPHYPLLEVSGAGHTGYLKSVSFSYFDGQEWRLTGLEDYVKYDGSTLNPTGISPDRTTTDEITVTPLVNVAGGEAAVPTSLHPLKVVSPEPLLYSPDDMAFITEDEFPEQYTFQAAQYAFTRQKLADAKLDIKQEYLQLPSNITQRTYELADSLTSGIESPFLKSKAIEDYLKTNYNYDLETESAPNGREPNDYFLFESKAGVCTNFNSAFVILCRAAGIPARLAAGYAMETTDAEQTIYADQAHAWSEVKFRELGWYTFDATGANISPLIPTKTEITSVKEVIKKGDEFTVSGTVWTSTSKPAEGTLVEIYVNSEKNMDGAVRVGRGIVSKGRFEIDAVIPGKVTVGNFHLFAHSLDSARYAESWSDPAIKIISGTKIKLYVPEKTKAGSSLTVNGLLTGDFGEELNGVNVSLTLNGASATSLVTNDDGRFSWTTVINEPGEYVLSAIYDGDSYYLETMEQAEFRIVAPAVITLKTKGNTINKPVVFTGQLKEQETNEALSARSLSLYINGSLTSALAGTDTKGRFRLEYTFDTLGAHQAEVKYAGDIYYNATGAVMVLEIKPAAPFSPWPLLIAVLGLAAAAIGGWFLYKWMKNRRPDIPLNIEGEEEIEAGLEEETPVPWQSSSPGITLSIAFPQIKEPLPDVWGTGEEMQATFRLADETGKGISAPLEILFNGEASAALATDDEGNTATVYTFPAKGLYNLTAHYGKETDERKASAFRPIRIVDYREEIVDLFNKLVAGFRSMGIKVSDEYTPRKIQYLVLNAKTDIPEKALEDAIYCFEETDYSLHQITREHYEKMYLAQLEILRYGHKPATDARD